MRHILSVSLGSSKRDKVAHTSVLGEDFLLERRGTDGDLARLGRLMVEHDGRVDALCLGGTNLGLHWKGRFYPFREIEHITRQIRHTPVADGAGVKNTLERETIRLLQEQGVVDFSRAKVFLVCATDRFGMAEALAEQGSQMVIGDLMFNVGLPVPIHSTRTVDILAPLALPLLRRLPFRWLYPTGGAQDVIRPKYERYYRWAEVIAGDFLLIRKHLPDDLRGKIIITNTTNEEDVEQLRRRGVRLLITTTPVVEGRSFGTNVLEGIFAVLLGRRPEEISAEEYLDLARRIGWAPVIRDLAAGLGA